jgi:Holliday junction resolvase RusA-like endonuclease
VPAARQSAGVVRAVSRERRELTLLPIVVSLDGPPRGKGRGRAVSTTMGARVYTDAKTRSYEAQLRYAAQQVMAGAAPIEGPLRVDITANVSIPRSMPRKKQLLAILGELRPQTKPDWDNYAKVCDSMNGVVWGDDKQIVDGQVRKFYSERPGLHIRVSRP